MPSSTSPSWIEGSGPVVILVHGGPGMDASSLRAVSSLLRDRFRVAGYHQRRIGGSSGERPSLKLLVQQLEELRQHLEAERCLFIGHSWGAGLAALYAQAYPARVAGLVLLHPMEISSQHLAVSLRRLERRRPWKDRRRAWELAHRLRRLSRDDVRRNALELELLRMDFRLTCADAPRGRVLDSLDLGSYDRQAAEAIWQDLQRCWPGSGGEGYDLAPVFENLRVPVQVVAGKHDVIDPQSNLRIAEITQGRYVRLEHSGHWSFLEQPEKFRQAVGRFLHECQQGASRIALPSAQPNKFSAGAGAN